jgi:hypothetical protein
MLLINVPDELLLGITELSDATLCCHDMVRFDSGIWWVTFGLRVSWYYQVKPTDFYFLV